MNTVTVENSDAAVEESSLSFQEIHIFFNDIYGGDHHLRLFVEQGDDDETKAKAKAKAKNQLERKDVDVVSVTVMTQEEYERSPRSKHQVFYVVYHNGRRRQISILATDKAEAEEIFNRRVSGSLSIRVFSRLEYKPLETGDWKRCPLSPTSQN